MSTEKMEEPQTEQPVDRTEAQLVEQVKNQVEYYFSKENLMSDPFLSSQMDAQMCVPISVVMKFAKLKALTHDESILRKALVDSTAVSIVDNKIKANIKPPGRSTIILREIPSDASEEEVKEIFNYPGAKPVSSLRSEIGDTWFVTMESEEDAKDTLLDLRLKKRTFRGAAVKGRLKTETVVRSFFPVQTAMAPVVPFPGMMPAVGMPVVDMRAFGYMGMPVPVLAPVDPSAVDPSVVAGADSHAQGAAQGAGAAAAGETRSPTKGQASTPSAGNKDARGKGANSASTSGNNAKGGNNAQGRRQDGKDAAAGSNGRTKGANKEKKEEAAPRPTIELNLASFPPLGGEDTPIPTPGYKGPFLKYSGDEIINIAKAVKEAKLPEALNPAQHPLAMTAEPNKDLLKRQRTFSIDETREQLRQGRPVQREAILPGKVDSRSLYYGDEPASAPAHKKESATAPAAPVTTPSAAKKEATAAAADVVEQVTSAAAALAVGDSASPAPAVVEPMNASAPQTITPSSWAAMLKSSASAADAVGAKPAVSLPVKRTPAKAPAPEAKAASSSAVKPSGKGEAKGEKDGETRRKKGEGKDKEGASPRKEGRRRTGSNDAASRPEKAASAEEGDKTESAAPAAATSSWGGKASFANILKLNADAEAFQPTAASVSPKPAAPASAASSSSSGDRRRAPQQSSSSPSKPSASAVAAASKRSEASTTKSSSAAAAADGDNGEWSTSTGRARNHRNNNNSEHRERGEGREHRDRGDREHRERGDREHRDRGDREGRPAAGSGSTATSGANAKGAWARETLPPVAAKEEK